VEPTPTPRKPDPELEKEIAKLAEPSKKDVEIATRYITDVNPNDPFGNSNWLNEIRNNLGSVYDSDYKMLKLLRRVEKQTGLKGLEDDFYRATDAVRKSQQIATAKVQDNVNLNKAYQGLSNREAKEFDTYIKAEKRLAREPISEDTTKLTQIVESGKERFGERTQALTGYYKGQAQLAREANLIDDFTYRAILDSSDYIAMERKLNEVLGQQYVRPRGERGKPKEKTSSVQAINMASRLEYNKNKNVANTQIKDTLESIGLAKQVDEASERTITLYSNGEKQYWEVPADVMDIVKTMDRKELGVLTRIVSFPTRLFRLGTTGLQATFAVPAYIMDLAGSAIVSKNIWATHNPKVIIEGLYQSIKNTATGKRSPMWQKFEQMGLAQTLYDDLRNAKTAEALERQLRKGTIGRLENAVKNPIRTIEDIIGIGEKAVRYQNFRGTYRNAIKRGLNEAEAYKEAYLSSAKNSVNFARGSEFTRLVGLAIPYFGARTQGARQLLESFRDRPIPTTMKSLAIVGLPQVATILYAYSDPKTREIYENIIQDEKDKNLIFISPDAKQNKNGVWEGVWKLPKPPGFRELWQPLADLTEQFAGSEKETDIKGMFIDLLETISPIDLETPERRIASIIPQQLKPAVQAYINKDLYFGKPIVPKYMIEETDDPTKRTKKSTSGGVELLAKQLNMSPIQLEQFIGSTLGTGGRQLINLVDTGLASAGIIDKEKIGGRSVPEGLQTKFFEARGDLLPENKTPGQLYFDAREEATQGLTAKEVEVYNTLNPKKRNFLGEDIFDENKRLSKYTRAGLYLQYPNVLEAERKLNLVQVQNGNPSNPLFGLPDDKLAKVLLKEALPPGAKDPELSKLSQEDWYREYQSKRGKYFDEVKAKLEREGKNMAPQENPYPSAPANIQKAMDTYFALPEGRERNQWKKANPQLWEAMRQQWELQDLWEDKERVKIGLAEVNEPLTPPKAPTIRLKKAKAPRALSTLLRGKPMSKDVPKVKGSLELVRLKGSKKLPTLKLKTTAKKAPTLKIAKTTKTKPLSTKKIRIKTSKIK
jgi:HD-GYP domain-containing protein (c-di-GMP phosphodiesterase class II)